MDDLFQKTISNMVDNMRHEELKHLPVLSVGEIIAKLEAIIKSHKDKDLNVCFDFADLQPTTLNSWRGVYAELALGFSTEWKNKTAKELLKEFKKAVGKTFIGWKGGDFVMGRGTPVWVANPGNSGNTAIIDIKYNGYEVVLITQEIEREL